VEQVMPANNNNAGYDQLKSRALDVLLEQSGLGIAVLDSNLVYRYINPTLARFNGPTVDEHIGKTIAQVLPTLADSATPLLQQALLGTPLRNFEIRVPTPSTPGEDALWLASYLPIQSNAGCPDEVIGVLVIAENETLVQQLERTRREASELVRRVLDSLFSFVGIMALDGTLLDANRAPLEAAGISIDDVVGKKFWDCYWWSYDPAIQARVQDWVTRAAQGEIIREDVGIRIAGDTRMTIDFMLAPLCSAEGSITHLIPSANDVSARVESEHDLKDSEERFRRVVDSTLNGLLLVDESGHIHLANQRAAEMFGYTVPELLTLNVDSLVPQEHSHRHAGLRDGYFRHAEARAMALRQELFARRRNGSLFPIEIGLTPLAFQEGLRVLATVVDVSVQKSIQAELMRALDEKTALLNEVHHRVKNNLQVVSSLLNLQARSLPHEVRGYFQESQDRIRAMALIHQLLYEQKSFEHVDAVSYVHRLVGLLKRSYLSCAANIRVSLNAPSHLYVPLEVAQPFGLLLNELVTNSIKHAFVDRSQGEISVSLTEKNREVCIVIGDDGVGLPEGIAPGEARTLGFQLIPGLVEQMNATWRLLPGPGTHFEVTFFQGERAHETL
jgi:two-component system, sensor histidine kinase PdtaS